MSNDKPFSSRRTVKVENVVPIRDDVNTYELESINASDIKAKSQPWLWSKVIPLDTSTLFVGEGGIGKSSLLLDVASKQTTGEEFKAGGETVKFSPGQVIILTAEDDFEYQVKPKLLAAGADHSKIEIIKTMKEKTTMTRKFVDLKGHLHLLENKINEMGNVKMIIIDPISYFTGDLKDHVNVSVANFLDSLNTMAKKYHLVIILNKHFRKQASGSNIQHAMSEVAGCGSWVNTPRAAWVIAKHPEIKDMVCMVDLKSNLKKKSFESLAYQILPTVVQCDEGSIDTIMIDWFPNLINISAAQIMSEQVYEKSKEQAAYDFIIDHLKINGQSVRKTILDAAEKIGIKTRTFNRAIDKIKEDEIVDFTAGVGGNKLLMLRKS